MAVQDLTNAQIDAITGARLAETGLYAWQIGDTDYHYSAMNALEHLNNSAAYWFRVVEDDGDDLYVRIMPGRCRLAGQTLSWTSGTLAGTTSGVIDLSSYTSQTAYIWLYANAGTITVATGTSWPSYAHIKLAAVAVGASAITSITDRRAESILRPEAVVQAAAAYGTWAIDGDGAATNGGGIVGDVTETEQAAALAVVDDGGTQALLSAAGAEAGYTANYQIFPDSEVADDAAYFGAAAPFCELAFDVATAGVYSGDAVVWEYYDGATWSTLTLAQDNTDTTAADGKRPFQQDGALHFVPPSDWSSTSVNSQSGHWIRARISSAAVTTAPVLNSVEHKVVAPTDPIYTRTEGLITDLRASDAASTLHTTTDVKFVLFNFTTGAHSGELTWAQDQRVDAWTGLTLSVSAGDALGVVVTQEDGTNEISNAILEMTIQPV